jgi:glycogen phosphorylase/synthase
MKDNILSNKELLFEIAWDVCNSKSDIGKVILSKLDYSQASFDNYILIGPNINNEEDIEEFTEDQTLLADWKKNAKENYGLSIKIGYWNCHNKPIAIMVDYSSFMIEKDKIFASFWERFFLDSLTGGIDYIEKALFGYATGKVIESYTKFFNIETPIAHFHEWTSGAGILYLKQNYPNVATVFTAHSTVLGKAIAKEKKIFHSNMNEINGEKKSLRIWYCSKTFFRKKCCIQY